MVKQIEIKNCFNYFNEISPGYLEGYNPAGKEYTSAGNTFMNRLHESDNKAIHSHTSDIIFSVSFTEKITSKLSAPLLRRYISAVLRRIPAMLLHLPQSINAVSLYESRTPQPTHHMFDVMCRTPKYKIRISIIMSRIPKMLECISFFMSRTHALLDRVPECLYNVPVSCGQDPLNSRNSSKGKQRLSVPFNFIISSARRFPVLNGNISL